MSADGPEEGIKASASPSGRHRRPVTRRERWRTVVLGCVAVVTVAVGLGIGLTTWKTSQVAGNVSRVNHAFPREENRPAPPTQAQAQAAVTFLVAAVEPDRSASAGVQPDAVLLIRLAADRAHAQVIFLPLDAWLAQPGTTPAQAFTRGGSAGLIGAVEAETGVRMDHYAQVDFDGFRTITDALGGVDIDVPQPYANHGYTFPVGPQHLDGGAAVAYLRDTDEAATVTTAVRMQAMVQALFDRLSQQGLLSDIGRLSAALGEMTKVLSVDDTLDETALVRLAWDERGVREPAFVTVPLSGQGTENGAAVRYLGDARTAALWSYLRADTLNAHLVDFE